MQHCIKCGAELSIGAEFCIKCGARVPVQPRENDVRKEQPANQQGVQQFSSQTEDAKAVELEQRVADAERRAAEAERKANDIAEKEKAEKKKKREENAEKRKKTGKKILIIILCLLLAGIVGIAAWYFISPMSAHLAIPMLPCPHDWQAATCTEAKTCSVCGETEGQPAGHRWQAATCTEPEICLVCGTKQGEPNGHKWNAATCTAPETCSVCGLTQGNVAHNFAEATCLMPQYCRVCGITVGEALGHSWLEATLTAPKTCERCGTTEGEPKPQPVYLIDMQYTDKFGKLYIHKNGAVAFRWNNDYTDTKTNGYYNHARDNKYKTYENGFHLDGATSAQYYITFDLGQRYTTLTGTVGVDYDRRNASRESGKCIYIYGDGVLLYTSPALNSGSYPKSVSVDVTGVSELKIMYSDTRGQNDLCVFYDALLS